MLKLTEQGKQIIIGTSAKSISGLGFFNAQKGGLPCQQLQVLKSGGRPPIYFAKAASTISVSPYP